MSWWGKLAGGAFGFMLGGPLGALLGAAIGHNLDRGFASIGSAPLGEGATERIQQAFFAATFSIMGHLAKADGRVSDQELAAARHIMSQMRLNEEQKRAAMHLFNNGKQPDFPLDEILDQFQTECLHRHDLVQMFMEIQIATVLADGRVHKNERVRLYYIAKPLGFLPADIDRLIAMVQAQEYYVGGNRGEYDPSGAPSHSNLVHAYTLLGIKENATDAEVKTAYRKLMSQHHPDKLVSRGLPEEMMKLATEKTQEIKAAYEAIVAARKT